MFTYRFGSKTSSPKAMRMLLNTSCDSLFLLATHYFTTHYFVFAVFRVVQL